jgi:hypothetical protein
VTGDGTAAAGCNTKHKTPNYKFIDVETLVADFLADVEQVRKD